MKKQENHQNIDGRKFYEAFARGVEKVIERKTLLDKINVFPVADNDTGTNLAQTLKTVAEKVKPKKSIEVVSEEMAKEALMSSRGNSGLIFAQFIHGISKATKGREKIHFRELAQIMKEGTNHAYEAINEPVEGTILTVMRDWTGSFQQLVSNQNGFLDSLNHSLEAAQRSLQDTKTKLKELKQAGVVDAGAKGFVLFLEGISEFFREGKTASFSRIKEIEDEPFSVHLDPKQAASGPRYCTEVILQREGLKREELQKLMKKHGNSLVIAGGEGRFHAHIHTEEPARIFARLKDTGTILDQKVEDMKKQYEAAYERQTSIALVTDSTCDLPEEIVDSFPIYTVPLTITFGENKFLDKVTLKPDQFYKMLEEQGNAQEFPSSSQPSIGQFKQTYSFLLEHYDSIVSLHISGKLSGTVESAKSAAESIDRERISVVDTKQLSTSLGLVVREVAKQLVSDPEHATVLDLARQLSRKTKILVSVRDLKYMIKGGRVSKMKGLLAKLLNFKPIISLDSKGSSELHGKPLLRRSNYEKMLDILQKPHNGSPVSCYAIGHVNAKKEADRLAKMIEKEVNLKPDYSTEVSPLIGSHAGIGAVSVSYLTE